MKSFRRLSLATLVMMCSAGCGRENPGEREALLQLAQLGAQITLNSERSASEVSLASKPVGDAELELLEGLTALEDLDLSGTDVTDAGLVHLSDLENLRSLNLADGLMKPSNLTDEGLQHFKNLRQLEELVLSGAKITDAGLEQLAPLKNLKRLYLFDTRITDAGLEHLEGLRELEILRVGRTAVTPEAAEQFQAKMPKLTRLIEAPPEEHSPELDDEGDTEDAVSEEEQVDTPQQASLPLQWQAAWPGDKSTSVGLLSWQDRCSP